MYLLLYFLSIKNYRDTRFFPGKNLTYRLRMETSCFDSFCVNLTFQDFCSWFIFIAVWVKFKSIIFSQPNSERDKTDLQIYAEVARLTAPPILLIASSEMNHLVSSLQVALINKQSLHSMALETSILQAIR